MTTFNEFHDQCIARVHHLHVAIIASMFHMTIDELIEYAFNNEFDDFEIYNANDFVRMIDTIYSHVN